jgi:hypothetical protein
MWTFCYLHKIVRVDRGQERQNLREKQKKMSNVTEKEGEMDSKMEI